MGLLRFVALCVMVTEPEYPVTAVGENLTVTVLDCPGDRLKDPAPDTIVKPPPLIATFPLRDAVEPDELLIVNDWLADCPTVPVPKSMEVRLRDIRIGADP